GTEDPIDDDEARGPCRTEVQMYSGYQVIGGETKICFEPDGLTVRAAFGEAIQSPPSPAPDVEPDQAAEIARSAMSLQGATNGDPQLYYFIPSTRDDDDAALSHLVWKVNVRGTRDDPGTEEDGQPEDIDYLVDAHSGQVVAANTHNQPVLNRRAYDALSGYNLPGILRRVEGQGPVPDGIVNIAFDNTGFAWIYYRNAFGRDSFNGFGAIMHVSVHYGFRLNNAFWNGAQTTFGD